MKYHNLKYTHFKVDKIAKNKTIDHHKINFDLHDENSESSDSEQEPMCVDFQNQINESTEEIPILDFEECK